MSDNNKILKFVNLKDLDSSELSAILSEFSGHYLFFFFDDTRNCLIISSKELNDDEAEEIIAANLDDKIIDIDDPVFEDGDDYDDEDVLLFS